MSAGRGAAACARVMTPLSRDGASRSGSVPAIDQEQEETERIAVVNHQRVEGEEATPTIFSIDPSLNKEQKSQRQQR